MLQQLKERYQQYDDEMVQVRKDASPMDGVFGFGSDPKKHPCHRRFYEDVGKWMQTFLASGPDEAACAEAASFLICEPSRRKETDTYWMTYAAQGWCRELVKSLKPADCKRLQAEMDRLYPRIDRLPAQRELYKALKKRGEKGNRLTICTFGDTL